MRERQLHPQRAPGTLLARQRLRPWRELRRRVCLRLPRRLRCGGPAWLVRWAAATSARSLLLQDRFRLRRLPVHALRQQRLQADDPRRMLERRGVPREQEVRWRVGLPLLGSVRRRGSTWQMPVTRRRSHRSSPPGYRPPTRRDATALRHQHASSSALQDSPGHADPTGRSPAPC